ncbi:MAG: hypothetical protein ACP5E9_02105 [Candidatus Methanospirareceae archaeon]
MTFDASNLKVYQCAFWNEGDEHGGDIDLANEISLSKIEQNIFDDITNAERVAGDTDYRKIFVRNENEETWAAVVAWISQLTLSPDDEIKILRAATKSKVSTPAALTGTATFVAGQPVVGVGTAFLTELAPGECIYNSTDDDESKATAILSITDDTHLTLADDYGGTTGEGKAVNVAGVDVCLMFASPTTKATGLSLGDIAENEYKGLWIKRIVDAAASGYENNQFAIKLESS